METCWIPGVNRLGTHGRWAFAELTDVYTVGADFADRVKREVRGLIEETLPAAEIEAARSLAEAGGSMPDLEYIPRRKKRDMGMILADTTAKLDNPTFLVGRNGAGKSNFVDAFSFLAEAMVSPLPAVFDRRGGVTTVTHRTSNRGRRADLSMRVDLKDLEETTERAGYAFELRTVKDYGFKVVREQCVVVRKDGSKEWFNRCDREFKSSHPSLEPAPTEDALVAPLVGGHRRFRAVHQCLAEMAVYRIDPAVLREMQDSDD